MTALGERVESRPRTGLPPGVKTVLSFLLGLAVASCVLLLLGANPITAWSGIVSGSIGSVTAVTDTLRQTVPVALIAIGVAVSFRAGLWNAGGNGQFLVGAAAAAVIGIQLSLPAGSHLAVALVAATVGGALFSLAPGLLLEYRGANEILTTLMLNFVGALLAGYVISGPLRATFTPSTVPILRSAELPLIEMGRFSIHPGVVFVVAVALLLGMLLKFGTFGLNVRTLGANSRAAELAGIDVRSTRLRIFALAGGLAGLSGGIQVVAIHHALVEGMSPNYGFTAIVAALLGGLTTRGAVVASFGMSALLVGGQSLQRTTDYSIAVVFVIQGALLVTLLAARVIGRSDRAWR